MKKLLKFEKIIKCNNIPLKRNKAEILYNRQSKRIFICKKCLKN